MAERGLAYRLAAGHARDLVHARAALEPGHLRERTLAPGGLVHAQVDVRNCPQSPQLGERVTVIPNHICPCVNLQDIVWWRDEKGQLVELAIDARGLLV